MLPIDIVERLAVSYHQFHATLFQGGHQVTSLKDKDDQILIISKDLIKSLRSRLLDSSRASQCREELERMLEIKQTLFWRADAGSSCVGRAMSAHLFGEVRLLEATLDALYREDYLQAAASLEEFSQQAELNGSL